MDQKFEYKGIWWLPNKSSKTVPGIIKYSPEEGTILDLIGAFETNETKFELILGFLENGEMATLYNSFETYRGFNSPGLDSLKIYSNFAILGDKSFDKISLLKFQHVTFYLRYLDEWVNKSEGFKIENDWQNREVTIKYKLPDNTETQVANRFKLLINPTSKGPIKKRILKEVAITQRINTILIYSRKKSFDKILEDMSHFEQFLTLCCQKPTYPLEFNLFAKDDLGKFSQKFKVYFRPTINIPNSQDLNPSSFLVPFKTIESSFDTLINNWFNSQTSLETCYIPYFNNFYGNNLHTSDKFLNICRALEAFHRDTVGTIDPSTNKEYHYKKRLLEVFTSTSTCFNFLLKIRDKNKFIEKIKNYRNDFTHSNQILIDKNKKYLETHFLTEKLTIVMTCAILRFQGMPNKDIKDRIMETRLYTHLKYKMR